ncbi:hypothetical protein [Streptomyces phytophilus]|uniref:hypothetical protein n=1 Tax=Streptomyces phytophilus TaxID=722715 RepID=UPI0015F0D62D|nr:hypothetical protein [Streptomyces phytophilus]
MRRHLATAVVLTAVATFLAGCSSSDDGTDDPPTSKSPLSQEDRDKALADAGIPPVPNGATRTALIDVLRSIDPAIVNDEDKAIDAARNQCSAINGGSTKADWTASQRFSYDGNEVSEAEGKLINEALKALKFCDV